MMYIKWILFLKGIKSSVCHMPDLYIFDNWLSASNRHDQNQTITTLTHTHNTIKDNYDVQILHVAAIGVNAFWKQGLHLMKMRIWIGRLQFNKQNLDS